MNIKNPFMQYGARPVREALEEMENLFHSLKVQACNAYQSEFKDTVPAVTACAAGAEDLAAFCKTSGPRRTVSGVLTVVVGAETREVRVYLNGGTKVIETVQRKKKPMDMNTWKETVDVSFL